MSSRYFKQQGMDNVDKSWISVNKIVVASMVPGS